MTVTPSDRPKSVSNRCVIKLFGDVFVLLCCPFDIPVGIRAFVIGLSQISSFLARLHFSAEELLLYPRRQCPRQRRRRRPHAKC